MPLPALTCIDASPQFDITGKFYTVLLPKGNFLMEFGASRRQQDYDRKYLDIDRKIPEYVF